MHHHKRSVAAMLVAALSLTAVVGADGSAPAPPSPGVFFDQYYSLYLGKTKCGWAWFQLDRQDDRVLTRNKMTLRMGRDNLTLEVNVVGETVETLDGKPLSFHSEMDLAGSKTAYRGDFNRSLVTMHITQAGQTTTQKFPVPPDTTMAWGDYLLLRDHLKHPGKTFASHSFDPQLGPVKVGQTAQTVHGPGAIEIAGKKITGIKVVARSEQLGPFPITSYYDKKGFMLATDMQVGILKLQLVAASKTEALSDLQREDIFTRSFVKLAKPLKLNPKKYLALKLGATGADPLPDVPQTTMQKIVARQTDHVVLHTLFPGRKRYRIKEPPPAAIHLADTTYTKLDDPILIKLADQAAGATRDRRQIADRICRFVPQYITEKTLAKAFATASETARAKAGDCTEHAVLMTALARIRKIPARVVSGLVYTDRQGPYGAFGYHMWTQVYLDDQWLDMDPTFGQTEPDPTHIALAVQDLSEENFLRQAVTLVKFIGQLRIEQLEK